MAARRRYLKLTALGAAFFICSADTGDNVKYGSAPKILDQLVPAWLVAANDQRISVPPPFGPPQGRLDPALMAFLEGRRDFAFLTRDIAEADLETYHAHHNGDPAILPVAAGAWDRFGYVDPVVFIVHRSNPLKAISFRQIDALLSQSRWRGGKALTDWRDLGLAAWRGQPVHVIGAEAWANEESARALTVRRRVLSVPGRIGQWRQFPQSGNEADVVKRVGADPLAIGFTGLGHLSADVRPLALDGGDARPVAPTRAAIASGRYPLARTVDLLIARNANGCLDATLFRFATFLIGPAGQEIVRKQGVFLPLTDRQRQRARAVLTMPCR